MNTPPTGFFQPRLDENLLDVKLRQLTPEIQLPESAQSSKWSAELAAHGLDPATVHNERLSISDKDYWQIEALTLAEALLRQSHGVGSEANRWKKVCVGMQATLKQQGVNIEEHRQYIDKDRYWELEAECLAQYTARRESELLDRLRKHTKGSGRMLLSPGSETGQQSQKRRNSRRAHPGRVATNCHGMALRTSPRVAKRGTTGAKARQSRLCTGPELKAEP